MEKPHFAKEFKKKTASFLLLAFCVSLLLSITFPIAAFAAEENIPTYKVGVFGFDSFLSKEDTYTGGGYAGEYLNKIAKIEGIRFEYIEFPYEEVRTAFDAGHFDLYAGVPYRASYENFYDFSDVTMGKKYIELVVPRENNTYAFDDYDSFGGLRVGYLSNSHQYQQAAAELQEKCPTVVLVPIEGSSYSDAWANNEIDAVISSSTKYVSGYAVIARFSMEDIYFGMSKDVPELTQYINDGMMQIDQEDNAYRSELFNKYFGNDVISDYFTAKEQAYIRQNPDLNVYYSPNRGYLSELRDGVYCGIEEDFVAQAASIAGFQVNIVDAPDTKTVLQYAADGTINLFPGLTYSSDWSADTGFYQSDPYLTIYYYMIRKADSSGQIESVACIKGTEFAANYIAHRYDEDQIQYYETADECLDAVKSGKADATFVTNYIAQYYLKQYEYRNLSMTIMDYSYQLCFGVPKTCDSTLATILTKSLHRITDAESQEIITQNTSYVPASSSFLDFVYAHPIQGVLCVMLFTSLLLALIFASSTVRVRNRQKLQLEQALTAAEKATNAKSDFLSRMSHDIRTPLNAVLGYLNIAREQENDPKALDESLSKIEYAGKYLLRLINDILDMSKIESGKVELNETVVDGPKFLTHIVDLFKGQANEKNITLQADFSKVPTQWLYMDELRTQQIYSNLLNNAIKFSGPGTTITWTIVDTPLSDGEISFVSTITDQGCGMSEAFMQHIFQSFEQEQNAHSDQEGGTGLGLAIVKRLVELMGGTITVESELGKGSTFTIQMTRKLAPAPAEPASEKHACDSSILSGCRLLLCEDHPMNREIAIKLLKKKGVAVDTAVNGQEGVSAFDRSPVGFYDAVLMDIRMPVMNGFDATRAIRRLNRKDASSVAIIAMTANAFDEDIKECLAAGMNAHIAKPFDPAVLYETLAKAIQ